VLENEAAGDGETEMSDEHPVAIVTGAGSGIGRACAIRFADEGVRVVVVDSSEAGGRATVDMLTSRGAKAIFCHTDVSVEDQCMAFARAAVDVFGRIDVLVGNAGIRIRGTILQVTGEDWDRILGVNLKGVAFSCKAVLPKMIEQKSGSIVLIGSTAALTATSKAPLYEATKYGVIALTRNLAAEYGKNGIRVNAICPALTLTEYHIKRAEAGGMSYEKLKESKRGYGLLGRTIEPEEVAAAVWFMAGKEAAMITGQYLMVDGGFSIGSKTLL
jgi:NAD(P)-dependent dehydrogenase (short-subunit alcohol dehydrogenase family)